MIMAISMITITTIRAAIMRTIITDMIMVTITAIRTIITTMATITVTVTRTAARIIMNMAPAPIISIITARCRKRSA